MAEEKHIIERLRKGETIHCGKCGKGIYTTSAKNIAISHEFRCDKCGSIVRVSPNIIVK